MPLSGREYRSIVADNSRISPTATQLLQHLPHCGGPSVRIEAVDHVLPFDRDACVSCEKQAIRHRGPLPATILFIVEGLEETLPESRCSITTERMHCNRAAKRRSLHSELSHMKSAGSVPRLVRNLHRHSFVLARSGQVHNKADATQCDDFRVRTKRASAAVLLPSILTDRPPRFQGRLCGQGAPYPPVARARGLEAAVFPAFPAIRSARRPMDLWARAWLTPCARTPPCRRRSWSGRACCRCRRPGRSGNRDR